MRRYDAITVWSVIKSHNLPCVVVSHSWSYRTRKECEPHIHLWICIPKPLTVETFNTQYIKKGLPELDGRRGEYSTTDPMSFKDCVRYMTLDVKGYRKKGMDLVGFHGLNSEQHDYLHTCLLKGGDPMYDIAPEVPKNYVVTQEPKVSKKKTTLDKQIMFYEYCKDIYESEPDREVSPEQLGILLADYFTRVGFTTPSSCAPYVMFALMRLLTDRGESDKRVAYQRSFAAKIAKSLFL